MHIADPKGRALDLTLAIPNCGIQEYSGGSCPLGGPLEGGFIIGQGHLVHTGEPGLGFRVSEEKLNSLPPLTTRPKTRWRRPDGAVQDW